MPGLPVTYQITVTNAGPNSVTGAAVLDTPPATMTGVRWTCGAATGGGACALASGSGNISETVNLPAGASVSYTVTGTIAAGATGALENTATVAPPSGVTDLIAANNTSTDNGLLTPQVILSVSKSSNPKPGLAPGRDVRYAIVVSNSGASDATGVSIADAFTANVTGVTWTCIALSLIHISEPTRPY